MLLKHGKLGQRIASKYLLITEVVGGEVALHAGRWAGLGMADELSKIGRSGRCRAEW